MSHGTTTSYDVVRPTTPPGARVAWRPGIAMHGDPACYRVVGPTDDGWVRFIPDGAEAADPGAWVEAAPDELVALPDSMTSSDVVRRHFQEQVARR